MRRFAAPPLLFVAALAGACDRPASRSEGPAGRAAAAASDTATEPPVDVPTVYGTHYLFLSTEGALPSGIAVHFIARAEPERYVRDYRGWLFSGRGEWTRVAWAQLEEPPTRRPWRIFPARGLRLIVGEQGEITEILTQGTDGGEGAGRRAALRLGALLDRWEDPDAARRQIRQATLQSSGAPVSGILLEEQVVRPRATVPPPFQTHDSAILRLAGGDLLIFSHPQDRNGYGSSFAWASLGGVHRRWDRVDVQTPERTNDTIVGRSVPARWQLTIPEPGLRGELTAVSARGSSLGGSGASPVHLVYSVTGWIEVDGRRREAAGLLEHGEP